MKHLNERIKTLRFSLILLLALFASEVSAQCPVNAGPDIEKCLNTPSVTLPSGGTWTGAPASMLNGNVFTPNEVGTYTLTLSNSACSDTDSMVFTVLSRPTVNAGADVTICPGSCHQLNAVASSPNGPIILYTWSGGAVSNSLSPSPMACPTGSGAIYSVTVVDNKQCNAQDQVTVAIQSPVTVNAGADMTLCVGSAPAQMAGATPAGGTWSGNGVTPGGMYTPGAVGTDILTYTYITSSGCPFSDTKSIHVVDAAVIDAGANRTACVGSTAFQLNPVTQGGTWSGSAYLTSDGVFNPAVIGTYTLTYSVNSGTCVSTDQISVTVFGLPSVSAGPDKTMCEGNSVLINGSASGGLAPYTVSWTGSESLSSSSSLTPTANPASNTTYVLTVIDARTCQASDAVTVTVHSNPVVDAGPDISVCAQSPAVQMTGHSPAGGTWSGSCVSSSGQFTPCGVGTYTLTYTVTNANGCSDSDTRVVDVTPSAFVDAGPDIAICRNEGVVDLGGAASSAGTWSGAGIVNASTGLFDPVNSGAGTHIVTLTIGSGNCQVSDAVQIQVTAEPNVSAGNNQSACVNGEEIDLLGASPAGGVWEGTGIVGHLFYPEVAGTGNHSVMYRYADSFSGCADTAYKNVEVYSIPDAVFTANATACTGSAITLQNSSQGANQYVWNFGIGPDVNGNTPNYTYSDPGNYTIRLVANNSTGCSDTAFQDIQIISAPMVFLSADTQQGCAPLTVNFNASVLGEQLSYSWVYGNGNTSGDESPEPQVYIENIEETHYTASLTATNICGTATEELSIIVQPRPAAMFAPDIISTICSPVTVEFENSSTGGVVSTAWDFGDGEVSSDLEPESKVYIVENDEPETYVISLTVQNQCGTDTYEELLTVQPNLVNASMSLNAESGCTPMTLVASNNGTGGVNIQYSYEPGVISAGPVAEFVFSEEGVYTIYQYATDGCGFDTTFTEIEVFQSPEISFVSSADEICQGENILFESTSAGFTTIEWTFGDGQSSFLPTVDKLYVQPGEYHVELNGVGTNGCTANAEQDVQVHAMPMAEFNVPQNAACAPFDICPMNTSAGGTSFHWDFGDGVTVDDEQPCYTFQNFSNGILYRNVVLTVSNAFGCTNIYDDIFEVYPVPSTVFTLPEVSSCEYPYALQPVGVGQTFAGYEWTVNGNIISNAAQPNLTLASPGDYLIALNAENEFGCENETQHTFVIYEGAQASFTSDVTSGCLDLPVRFTNTSVNAASYQWIFGDGGLSSQASPTYEFDEQGVFDVKLIVISPQGCSDTLVMHNYIETYPLPEAHFSSDKRETSIFDPEFIFTDESEDGVNYLWNFGDGNTSTFENPEHQYAYPGEWNVTLEVENMFGCKDEYSRTVFVSNDFQVYIPNSFTPNNDGLNDVFKPELEGREFIVKYKFQVFDRWGTVVFETEDPEMAWIGNTRGNDEYTVNDTFKYRLIVEIEQSAETKVFEGLVTIIR